MHHLCVVYRSCFYIHAHFSEFSTHMSSHARIVCANDKRKWHFLKASSNFLAATYWFKLLFHLKVCCARFVRYLCQTGVAMFWAVTKSFTSLWKLFQPTTDASRGHSYRVFAQFNLVCRLVWRSCEHYMWVLYIYIVLFIYACWLQPNVIFFLAQWE